MNSYQIRERRCDCGAILLMDEKEGSGSQRAHKNCAVTRDSVGHPVFQCNNCGTCHYAETFVECVTQDSEHMPSNGQTTPKEMMRRTLISILNNVLKRQNWDLKVVALDETMERALLKQHGSPNVSISVAVAIILEK